MILNKIIGNRQLVLINGYKPINLDISMLCVNSVVDKRLVILQL